MENVTTGSSFSMTYTTAFALAVVGPVSEPVLVLLQHAITSV